ncbi:hypothetical protein [Nocardioides lijunqiniae]|uniref:hypothetical protein n=1 Tax=Nocardioides lijunqiniae TaxID=2760832 RepID=UPI001877ADBC|nr:hypothetical protein [Nocardioides lijunqiniae]
MRRTLGPLLLLTLLAGCGDGDDGGDTTAEDVPASSSSPSLTPTPGEPSSGGTTEPPPTGEPVVVALLSETAAGGSAADVLTPVEGAAVDAFLAQLDSATLGEQVRAAVDQHSLATGHSLGAAVVALGCDVPPEVFVTRQDGAWTVTPAKVASPLQECFAPVTTVVVVDVPGDIAPAAADPAT